MGTDGASALPALRYADLDAPGYTRRRVGRGFSYLDWTGQRVSDPELIAWCKSLVIPPAWQDVWISAARDTHILSFGYDDRKRKQYVYHPEWQRYRNLMKFEGLVGFPKALAKVRAAVDRDLERRPGTRRRVIATAVGLIDRALIRVGNEFYRQENETFGATTLDDEHVQIDGDSIELDFTAKSGAQREVLVEDARLAHSLKACQELPGQRLFRYREGGELRVVRSDDVNAYLSDAAGEAVTAKDFRTWGGTVACFAFAHRHRDDLPPNPAIAAARYAAERLGNTLAVARRYYIHPALLEVIETGSVPPRSSHARKWLDRDETSTARFLEGLN